jgi:hypothetical protein
MNNLIYKYRIDNHKELNEELLAFFDTLPNRVGEQDYNLGISKFDGHNHISSPLLPEEWQYIDTLNGGMHIIDKFEELVTLFPNINYKEIFLNAARSKLHEHAKFHIQPEITGLSYAFNIMHMWYHQMSKSDYISWDNHQFCQWSAVYFIEVPDQKYITEFLNPETQEIMQPQAEAGDMLIFPSWLLHRAPKMLTDKRKSIIAWNMDITYVFPEEQLNNLKVTHPENWKL